MADDEEDENASRAKRTIKFTFQQGSIVPSEEPSTSRDGESRFQQRSIVHSEAPSTSRDGGLRHPPPPQSQPPLKRQRSEIPPPQRPQYMLMLPSQSPSSVCRLLNYTVVEIQSVPRSPPWHVTQITMRKGDYCSHMQILSRPPALPTDLWHRLIQMLLQQIENPHTLLRPTPLPPTHPPYVDGYNWYFRQRVDDHPHYVLIRHSCADCVVARTLRRYRNSERMIITYLGVHTHPPPPTPLQSQPGPSNTQ